MVHTETVKLAQKRFEDKNEDKNFCLGHVKFEMLSRHPRRNVKWIVCYTSLEIWGEVSPGDTDLGILGR